MVAVRDQRKNVKVNLSNVRIWLSTQQTTNVFRLCSWKDYESGQSSKCIVKDGDATDSELGLFTAADRPCACKRW